MLGGCLFVLICAGWSTPATAAPRLEVPPENQVVTVSPVIVEARVRRGETFTTQVMVFNQTPIARAFDTTFEDFGPPDDPTLDKEFLGEETAARGARDWMVATPGQFELRAGAEQAIKVTIKVPERTSVGGHYVALFVTDRTPVGGAIAIVPRVAVLFLLEVEGDVEHDTTVTLRARDGLVHGERATWEIVARNEGTIHEYIQASVRFSSILAGDRELDLKPFTVLPGGERRIPVRLPATAFPDIHTAELSLGRLTGGKDSGKDSRTDAEQAIAPSTTKEVRLGDRGTRIFRLPWWFVALTAALVVALIVWLVRRRHVGDEADWEPEHTQG